MDDSYVNGILYLAKQKMGLPLDTRADTFYIHVTLGNRKCLLTYEELKAKNLNLPQSNETDFDSDECKELQKSNQEQPIDLSAVKEENSIDMKAEELTSSIQVKTEKCDEGAISDSLSNESEKPINTIDEQVSSEQYYASTESNDSSYPAKPESTVPGSSNELAEEIDATPKLSQISLSAGSEMKVDSTKVEEKKVEHTSNVDQEDNQKRNPNHSSQNYNSQGLKKRCYRCHEMAYHRAWNCPKKRDGRDENKSTQWSSSYSYPKWRPKYKRYANYERNNPFNNVGINFDQKGNEPAKPGTFRKVMELLQNNEAKLGSSSRKKCKKANVETNSHHKIQFQQEWYTNRIAADAELFLNKKDEVRRQIKKEHRDLDEGFEDIQHVFSDDENPNENPVFVFKKTFKDEDNDPGSSSASFSTAA